MREIKFRASDEELSFMVEPSKYLIGMSKKIFFNNDGKHYEQSSKLQLMQYTGLKDKNGVEIFESDICINKVHWDEPREIGFNYLGTVCSKVKGDENSFHMGILKDIEVIGNVYENPELLETKA